MTDGVLKVTVAAGVPVGRQRGAEDQAECLRTLGAREKVSAIGLGGFTWAPKDEQDPSESSAPHRSRNQFMDNPGIHDGQSEIRMQGMRDGYRQKAS